MLKYLAALVVILGACGDDGGGTPADPDAGPSVDAEPGDTTGPMVVSVTPTDQSSGVATTTTIEVVFDEDLNASSVTTANFVLEPRAADTISYDAATFTVTMTTAAALLPGTHYSLAISGPTDLAGNLATDFASTFATANAAPQRLDSGGGHTHKPLAIAYNDAGHGVAIWRSSARGFTNSGPTWMSFFDANQGAWLPETTLPGTTTADYKITSNGTSFMVVYASDSFEITDAGNTWTVGSTISLGATTDELLTAGTSYLAFDRSARTAYVYEGTSWTTEVVAVGILSNFDIVSDGETFAATFNQPGGPNIFFSIRLSTGWSSSVVVDVDSTTARSPFIVGRNSGGGFVIAWTQDQTGSVDTDLEVWTALYTHDGTNVVLAAAPAVAGGTMGSSTTLSAMVAYAGGYLVAWKDAGNLLMASRSSDGTSWTTETAYASPTELRKVWLAADQSRVLMSYTLQDSSSRPLYGIVFDGNNWESAPTLLSASTVFVSLVQTAGFSDAITAANNRLGVSWLDSTKHVHVALNAPTGWTTVQLDGAESTSSAPSITASDSGLVSLWAENAELFTQLSTQAPLSLLSGDFVGALRVATSSVSASGLRASAWIQHTGHGDQVFANAGLGQWQSATVLSDRLGTSQSEPRLATSGDQALVSWDTNDGAYFSYFDGSDWQDSVLLDSQGRGLHVAGQGENFVLAWERHFEIDNVSAGSVMSNTLIAGVLGSEAVISTTTDPVSALGLTATPAGLAATWVSAGGGDPGLVALYAGGTWVAPTTFGSVTNADTRNLHVAPTSDGVGIFWSNSDYDLFFASVVSGSVNPATIIQAEVGESDRMTLHDDGSELLITYLSDADSDVYRMHRVGGVWQTPVHYDNLRNYNVATNGDGFLFAWTTDSSPVLSADVYANGNTASELLDGSQDASGHEAVAVGADYVCAYDLDPDLYSISMRRHSGGSWQAAEVLLPEQQERVTLTKLMVAPGQSLVTTWHEGGNTALWGIAGWAY